MTKSNYPKLIQFVRLKYIDVLSLQKVFYFHLPLKRKENKSLSIELISDQTFSKYEIEIKQLYSYNETNP